MLTLWALVGWGIAGRCRPSLPPKASRSSPPSVGAKKYEK